jgi:glycosyltransferase involved in cell wall biosynthesis
MILEKMKQTGTYITPHIALFFPSLEVGGVQRSMLYLMEGLVKRGVKVDAVLINAIGLFLDEIPQGVRLVDLHAGQALRAIPALAGYLREEQPDALLSAQNHVNVAAIIANRLAGRSTRLVVSEHSHLSSAARNANRLGDRLRPLLGRLFYPLADGIVACSNGVADDLSRRTRIQRSKIRVIYNPVPAEKIFELAKPTPEDAWYTSGQPPVVVAVGRLSPAKDYPTLLSAFKIVHSHRPVHLLILGEGPERPQLEGMISQLDLTQDVRLPGTVRIPFPYVAHAGVYVLSSVWEGFPNVLIEALACGAPIVSTNCPSGPAEILENGRLGRLTPVGDATALAAAIEDTLDHPYPSDASRSRALDFSVDASVKQYLEILLPEMVAL